MLLWSLLLLIVGAAATKSTTTRTPKEKTLINQPNQIPEICRPFIRRGCLKLCPNKYRPICGSNGVTYNNRCTLSIAQCLIKGKSKVKRLTIKYRGKCKSKEVDPCKKNGCPKINKPVCGSNRKTYRNKCMLDRVNCQKKPNSKRIRVLYRGKCKSKDVDPCRKKRCPKNYRPVCGSNRKTYPNKCVLDRYNCRRKPNSKRIRVLYKGKCKSKEVDPCKKGGCPKNYRPVCGSNNKTYNNKCMLDRVNCEMKPNAKRIRVLYMGRCKSKEVDPCKNMVCPMIQEPVCGSNGKTYVNKCLLKIANCKLQPNAKLIRVLYKGKCKSKEVDPCKKNGCPKINKPVCGSNRKTYRNKCMLNKVNCHRKPNSKRIRVLYKGKCKSMSNVTCHHEKCTKKYQPVCGSDGKTYGNKCLLKIANCKLQPKNKTIRVQYEGKCKSKEVGPCETMVCPMIEKPVCGSDGETYGNKCLLSIKNCRNKANNKPVVTVVYKGACKIIE